MFHTFTLSKCCTTLITGLMRNKLLLKSDSRRRIDAKVFYKKIKQRSLSQTLRRSKPKSFSRLEELRGEPSKVMIIKIQKKMFQSRWSLKLLSPRKMENPARPLQKVWKARKLATKNN